MKEEGTGIATNVAVIGTLFDLGKALDEQH